ncbi:MAG: hypothetical protein HY926_03195 [Elusimicrobia bacterium]|nr:hypothetical protein [Elusimicrobiota bacterium]
MAGDTSGPLGAAPGGRSEGGSLQGTAQGTAASASGGSGGSGGTGSSSLNTRAVPVIAPPAGGYIAGASARYDPASGGRGSAPGGIAARGGPLSGQSRSGGVFAGIPGGSSAQERARGRRVEFQAPEFLRQKGGGQIADWARRAADAWKRGEVDGAVQALFDGIDADAAARDGMKYAETVARGLLEAMGMDADAIARVMASKNFIRFRDHFLKALQARAQGNIDLARKEFARALAELLGGYRGPALLTVVLAAATVAGVLVFLAWRRRRQSQSPPA